MKVQFIDPNGKILSQTDGQAPLVGEPVRIKSHTWFDNCSQPMTDVDNFVVASRKWVLQPGGDVILIYLKREV